MKEKMKTVMILDGASRAALAMVRSFGQRGIAVIVGGVSPSARSLHSRYARQTFLYPDPSVCEAEAHAALLSEVQSIRPDVLIPIYSNTIAIVMAHKEEYMRYTTLIPLADAETSNLCDNKATLPVFAAQYDVSIPKTYVMDRCEELEDIARECAYPVLVKPRYSAGGFGIRFARTADALKRVYREVETLSSENIEFEPFVAEQPIVQEFITGTSVTVQAICDNGMLRGYYCAKSLRRYPLPFGPSVAYESVDNAVIRNATIEIVEKCKWHGPIILSFILEESSGEPKLIEINPRFGGTIEAAIAAGVDLPYIAFQMALKEKSMPVVAYAPGVRFHWLLFGEFFYFFKTKNKVLMGKQFREKKKYKAEISLRDWKPHFVHFLNMLRTRREIR